MVTERATSMNDFVKAISRQPRYEVTAHFKDGKEVTYSASVLHWLISEPSVEYVYDSMSGEVLYFAKG